LVTIKKEKEERAIYHKNLRPVDYVLADAAGEEDSPLYGLYNIREKINTLSFQGTVLSSFLFINLITVNDMQ